ncbi:hypothetical protein ACFWMR_42635, partial [Amycolatopsis thailandensis]|uniref:hypothetical protein n=1 Tax=Amycolatopsis thailandensis TaxID=589330 RepID=UPI003650ED7D
VQGTTAFSTTLHLHRDVPEASNYPGSNRDKLGGMHVDMHAGVTAAAQETHSGRTFIETCCSCDPGKQLLPK